MGHNFKQDLSGKKTPDGEAKYPGIESHRLKCLIVYYQKLYVSQELIQSRAQELCLCYQY